jgi:hypothetical protein
VPNDSGGFDNGVIYCGKHGGISIYPGPERFCLANHVESIAIEKFGSVTGPEKPSRFTRACSPPVSKDSRFQTGVVMLLKRCNDSFIEQLQTEGMPDMPVMH